MRSLNSSSSGGMPDSSAPPSGACDGDAVLDAMSMAVRVPSYGCAILGAYMVERDVSELSADARPLIEESSLLGYH